ncbi:MAG TPA: DUF4160 domain-containing protein [Candidatus Kapabacteria bacterium]
MPEISRFFGIVVYMYYDDHAPPHFHAEYAGEEIVSASTIYRSFAVGFIPAPWDLLWSGVPSYE